MASIPQPDDNLSPLPRRPGLTLSRRGLTLLFVTVLLCPVLIISLLVIILPTAHDHPLEVNAKLLPASGVPKTLRIINLAPTPLDGLRIELNSAFAYFPQASLPIGEKVDIPLEWFQKKTGTRFVSAATRIHTIDITARLPNNARAIYKKQIPTP